MRTALIAPLALLLLGAAPADRNAHVFDVVWRTVDRDYWDPAMRDVDWAAARARYRPQAMAARDPAALYRTIGAMLDLLHDSHVFAIPPGEVRYERALDHGAPAASYGFTAYRQDGGWLVDAVTPGSSAAQAGVRAGWTVATIDGMPLDADRHPNAGEQARIAFRDVAGRPRTIDLVAAPEPARPSVRVTALPGGTLLIAIDGFDADEDRQVARALRDRPPPAAVILDLRDNDGGEERIAARVAGLFFAHPRALLDRIDRRHDVAVPIAGSGPDCYSGPLAVLVGPRSASAAEALAALFAESGRAIAIGSRTAGALTGAELRALPDGGRLSIALFDVRTPGGRRIEGVGFVPEHRVDETPADMAAGHDRPLAEALRLLARAPGLSDRATDATCGACPPPDAPSRSSPTPTPARPR